MSQRTLRLTATTDSTLSHKYIEVYTASRVSDHQAAQRRTEFVLYLIRDTVTVVDLAHLNYLSYENRTKRPAPVLSFALFIGLQLIAVLVCIRYFFPSIWNQHVSSGVWAILLTGLICSLVVCFGEYFFHRYLLHLETVRFLRSLTTSHLTHHKLTSIWFNDATKRTHSKYPICSVAQDDQATFPPHALIPMFAAFTPFFAPIAFSFPEIPILISGYTSIAIALFLYETLHVMHHQPYETWWKKRLNNRIVGKLWRKVYGFHQGHHANYRCNLNVAGFFGIPVADLMFGTYKQPSIVLLDGTLATKEVARSLTPQPYWLVAWLDRVSFKRRRWMSKRN